MKWNARTILIQLCEIHQVSQLDILAEKLLKSHQEISSCHPVETFINPYNTLPTNLTLAQIISQMLRKFQRIKNLIDKDAESEEVILVHKPRSGKASGQASAATSSIKLPPDYSRLHERFNSSQSQSVSVMAGQSSYTESNCKD